MSDVEDPQDNKADKGNPSNQPITEKVISEGITFGWYTVKFDRSKNASEAYDVIQKVHYREKDGGGHVKPWYYCSRCKQVLETVASGGTQKLIRHKESVCSELTPEERKAYADARANKQQKAGKVKETKNAEKVEEADENAAQYVFSEDQLCAIITTMIEIDTDSLKRLLPKPSEW